MAITAVFNDSPTSPGYDISISGLTGSFYYKVIRRDLSGFLLDLAVRVAGANPDGFVTVSGDTAAPSDYEFSFATNIRYILEKYNSSKVLTATETVNPGVTPIPSTAYYGHAWLKDVFTAANSLPIIVGEFRSYSRTGRNTQFNILGRSNPVVITDVLSGKTGQITFYIVDVNFGTVYAWDEYDTLFDPGSTYFFQSLYPQYVGWKDFYLVVNSVEFERITLAQFGVSGVYRYTVDFTEVDRPATTSVDISAQTWEQVLNSHADWQDVLNSHSSWLDVYQDPTDLL